jgi:hypothetical protein
MITLPESRLEREQLPGVGDPFQGVFAAVGEPEFRTADEVAHRS